MLQPGDPAVPSRLEAGDPGAPHSESYAAAFARYRAAVARRDFTDALRTLDAVIERHPGFAELYDSRALVWRVLGDYVRASRDAAACRALDPHHYRLDAIRREVCELRADFASDPVVDPRWTPGECHDGALRDTLETRAADTARRAALLARPSCDLPCPSRCCFFEDEPVANGVHFTADELAAVREYLRAQGLDESDYVAQAGSVSYPRCGSASFGAGGIRPRRVDGGAIGWLTDRSRGCVFVGDTGCAIHGVGDPPGVAVCRNFLCLTAFVFLVARALGLASDADLSACAMADLDEAALAILPAVAAAIRSPERALLQAEMRSALAAAVESDRAHDASATHDALARFDAAHLNGEGLRARVRQDVLAELHVHIRKGKP
jgi:hypothetical protein